MNQKGFVNMILIIAIVTVFAGAGAYFILNRQAHLATTPTPTPISVVPAPGPITVNGKTACLLKKGSGQQTLECSIGLQGTDGRNYVLKGNYDPEYKFAQVGLDVKVSGIFTPGEVKAADGNKYDVVGTIAVISIKKVEGGAAGFAPSLASLKPISGAVGTQVTITGSRFTPTNNSVKFGGGYLNGLSSNGITITFTVPDGLDLCPPNNTGPCLGAYPQVRPGPYLISVINANGTSNAVNFMVTSSSTTSSPGNSGSNNASPSNCEVTVPKPTTLCPNGANWDFVPTDSNCHGSWQCVTPL